MLCVSQNSTYISTVLASRTLLRVVVWDIVSWSSPKRLSFTAYAIYYPTDSRGLTAVGKAKIQTCITYCV